MPDAELLTRLAEVLEVPVSTLLGSAIPDDKEPDDIARQLARINEQLAVKTAAAAAYGARQPPCS